MVNVIQLLSLCFSYYVLVGAAQESKLVFSFMVHRHGDRTPSEHDVKYSTDPNKLLELIKPYGFSQLTERGMQRSYRMGQFIRDQFDDLLGLQYNESNIFLRSTDLPRTEMTMLVALSAIYPPVIRWKKDLEWTPVPYTTVPQNYDFNRPSNACPKLQKMLNNVFSKKYDEMEVYNDVLELVTNETNADIDVREKPLIISDIYNTFEDQLSLGLNLTAKIQKALPEIKQAADKAYDIIYRKNSDRNSILALSSGLYDTSIFSITFIITIFIQLYVPIFGYDLEDGSYGIRRLEVDGCGTPCLIDQFKRLTQPLAWDYKQWIETCK